MFKHIIHLVMHMAGTFITFSFFLSLFFLINSQVFKYFVDTYNIAVGKPTDQGPATYCVGTYCGISDYAVDGNFGRCSHTDNKGTIQRSWWTVDFQGYYYIASIRIIRRSNGKENYNLMREMDGNIQKRIC